MMKYIAIKRLATILNARALKWLLFFAVGLSADAFAREQTIAALRSAYLYYFSNLMEWPKQAEFIDNQLMICAVTNSLDNRFQLKSIKGKNVGELNLAVMFLDQKHLDASTVLRCHILYIGEDITQKISILGTLPSSVLLVTEGTNEPTGHIHLFLTNNKLKFEINSEKLNNDNFKASSQLMRLSRTRGGNP